MNLLERFFRKEKAPKAVRWKNVQKGIAAGASLATLLACRSSDIIFLPAGVSPPSHAPPISAPIPGGNSGLLRLFPLPNSTGCEEPFPNPYSPPPDKRLPPVAIFLRSASLMPFNGWAELVIDTGEDPLADTSNTIVSINPPRDGRIPLNRDFSNPSSSGKGQIEIKAPRGQIICLSVNRIIDPRYSQIDDYKVAIPELQ